MVSTESIGDKKIMLPFVTILLSRILVCSREYITRDVPEVSIPSLYVLWIQKQFDRVLEESV